MLLANRLLDERLLTLAIEAISVGLLNSRHDVCVYGKEGGL
jgi:hypothetical protein